MAQAYNLNTWMQRCLHIKLVYILAIIIYQQALEKVRGVVWKKTEWQFVASKQLCEGMMGCNLGEIKPFRKEDITFML